MVHLKAAGASAPARPRRRRRASALLTTVALVALTALPTSASAAPGTVFTDGPDPLGADIRRVRVIHTDSSLTVRVRMARIVHLASNRGQSLTLFVDTDRSDPGPEVALTTGLNEGTDWAVRRVATWGRWGRVLHCDSDVRINWRTDRVRVTLSRDCLGDARSVRVALKSREVRTGTEPRADWLQGRRQWTAPAARR